MITKDDIEQAAEAYEDKKWKQGRQANYAALDFLLGGYYVLHALQAENEQLKAENARLRSTIEAAVDMMDEANGRMIFEYLQNALK